MPEHIEYDTAQVELVIEQRTDPPPAVIDATA
jgi:hypothetical protein